MSPKHIKTMWPTKDDLIIIDLVIRFNLIWIDIVLHKS